MNKKTIAVAIALVLTLGIVFMQSKKQEEENSTSVVWTAQQVEEIMDYARSNTVCKLKYGSVIKGQSSTNISTYMYVPNWPFPEKFCVDKATIVGSVEGEMVTNNISYKLFPTNNAVIVSTILHTFKMGEAPKNTNE